MSVPDNPKTEGLIITYLRRPYAKKKNVWAWDDGVEYDLDIDDIIFCLNDPIITKHPRSGISYFHFTEL